MEEKMSNFIETTTKGRTLNQNNINTEYIPYHAEIEECYIRLGISKKTNKQRYFLIKEEEIEESRRLSLETKTPFKNVLAIKSIEKGLKIKDLNNYEKFTLVKREDFFSFLSNQREQ